MSARGRRRSAALSAIVTASLTSAFGLAVTDAHAVNAGPAGSALTVSDGSSTLVVGGSATTLPTSVTDANWAPNGSRLVCVDGEGNLVSSRADGSDVRLLAAGGQGAVISHPTWMSDGGVVAYALSVNGVFGSIKFAEADGYGKAISGGSDGSYGGEIPSTIDGADSSPDAFFTPSGNHTWLAQEHIVYQHVASGGGAPEIFLSDPNTQLAGFKIADGAQPTVSPDGRLVAFVNPSGQIAVIDLRASVGKNGLRTPKVLTADTTHKQHPTFSPDGSRIAYEAFTPGSAGAPDTAKDVESIPAAGGAATVEWAKAGVPSYRPTDKTHVVRLAGSDRGATAIAASRAVWADAENSGDARQHARAVVLSRDDQFADALGGSALAADKGPLLLTHTAALDPAVRDELVRVLGPANPFVPQTVYVLGGTQALSPAVEKAVTDLGYHVDRLRGPDRYSTSVAIANAITAHPVQVLIATGNGYADALSAGAAAGSAAAPSVVVLTNDKTMPTATANYLKTVTTRAAGINPPFLFEIGGQAKAATDTLWPPANTMQRPMIYPLAGADRYETSFMVAREFFGDQTTQVGVATALNWPDSLSGGAVMAYAHGPLLLVDPQHGLTPREQQWVSANSGGLDHALIFGGTKVVAGTAEAQLGTLISGPAGYDTATDPRVMP